MLQDLSIVASIVMMECVLSIDNAAALATLVKHLPPGQREKALKYGIVGAYVFRWIALFVAAWLVKIAWLKLVWGLYLTYLAYGYFFSDDEEDGGPKNRGAGFWATVATVEAMDMVFSIDNVFAAVALSPNIWLVVWGVFVGILAMRFVAGYFVKLLERHPSLEDSAFLVIAVLGAKLAVGTLAGILGFHGIHGAFDSHAASAVTSGLTVLLFSSPFIKSYVTRSP